MARPESVTGTCWVIIALALQGLFATLSGSAEATLRKVLHSLTYPLPYSIAVSVNAFAYTAIVVLAFLMLRGFNWARIAYLCFMFLGLVVTLSSLGKIPIDSIVLALIKILIFGALLLRPQSNRFFVRRKQNIAV